MSDEPTEPTAVLIVPVKPHATAEFTQQLRELFEAYLPNHFVIFANGIEGGIVEVEVR